jgi:general secretion pathway protein I
MRCVRGFTLLEILVALTLFGLVGGALLELFGSGLRTARLATERTHAVLLARSKLTELTADPYLTPGLLEGEFDDGYRWQAQLTEAEEFQSDLVRALEPLHLDLTISWGDAGDERQFRLESLMLTQATLP